MAHALQWMQDGWGMYINADSAVYVNLVLGHEAAGRSIWPLIALGECGWGGEGKATRGGGAGKEGVVVVQGEYDSWEHFYERFVDGDLAVSLSPSWSSPTIRRSLSHDRIS